MTHNRTLSFSYAIHCVLCAVKIWPAHVPCPVPVSPDRLNVANAQIMQHYYGAGSHQGMPVNEKVRDPVVPVCFVF